VNCGARSLGCSRSKRIGASTVARLESNNAHILHEARCSLLAGAVELDDPHRDGHGGCPLDEAVVNPLVRAPNIGLLIFAEFHSASATTCAARAISTTVL
jgi:hypothetical protein